MIKRILAACGLAAICGAALAADLGNGYVGGMATLVVPSDVREASSDGPGLHLVYGIPLDDFGYSQWDAEAALTWANLSRDDQPGTDTLYSFGVDMRRRWDFGAALIPYALGGVGISYEEIRNKTVIRPQLSLGGGVLYPLNDAWALRGDIRFVVQENDYEREGVPTSGRTLFYDGRLGLGVEFAFGGEPSVARPVEEGVDECELTTLATGVTRADCVRDSDGDGVEDAKDLCPGTRPGAIVDSTGCELGNQMDSDGDGVFDDRDKCAGTAIGEAVDSQGCPVAEDVVLRGVTFEFDSAVLTSEAREILDSAVILLTGVLSDVSIEIAGHTDDVGTPEYNRGLSARRANSVKTYLIENGVNAAHLIATGYGETQPVATNETEEGRAENRRVVFSIRN